ncbi:helix-turn-helix domain-containing protein [Sporosarcina sp. 179-K 3D1 HS]|uniref:helix-turn-helix domain-containing protein n=1 Tax=Sporosarcina sp. 179-K 3D1 HS TaxID=3232169 RepID=UPI0039A2E038
MQIKVIFKNTDRITAGKLTKWIYLKYREDILILDNTAKLAEADLLFFHIRSLLDWVRLRNLQKNNEGAFIALIDETLLHTSPLSFTLKIQALLIHPVKKAHFYRCMARVMESILETNAHKGRNPNKFPIQTANKTNEQLDAVVLRRLLMDTEMDRQDFLHAIAYFSNTVFPNVVCFIQGFTHFPQKEHCITQLIQSYLSESLADIVPKIYFLPFHNHLLLLFKKPEGVASINQWEEGRIALTEGRNRLKKEHDIHLYFGIGSSYSNPEDLSRSYYEAKKARSTPANNEIHLRYFDELPKNPIIKKCTRYIAENVDSELTAQEIASYANLSYSYFSGLFKRETGKGFSEYLTLARLQQSVWLLRHSKNTMEEIADYVGFNTPNYFSTVFKKYVGVTPSEFKQTSEIFFL